MLSLKFKYIFLHTPKCAGTTIEKFLLEYEGVNTDLLTSDHLWADLLPEAIQRKFWIGNPDGRGARQHYVLHEYKINNVDDYFKFTFVRNPYAKAVSEWKYFKRIFPKSYTDSFKESLRKKNPYPWGQHAIPQHHFAKGCDFVGRVETFNEDWYEVCDRIGIARATLGKENVSNDRSRYIDYYDPDDIEVAKEKFADDIEYFDYEFGE